MYASESLVTSDSIRHFHTPSLAAMELFFYPTILGKYQYLPGYHQKRSRLDSFLIVLIEKGSMEILLDSQAKIAPAGSAVLIDCYQPHEYGSSDGCSTLWLHFDGPMARPWYNHLTGQSGNIIIPRNFHTVWHTLHSILQDFSGGHATDEALVSLKITQILHELLSVPEAATESSANMIHQITAYINEHFCEDIPLETLAKMAHMSPYYFSRVFKKETGLTPHQYVIATRISSAKYFLSTTNRSVCDIAYDTGFKDESSFCYTFRKREGMTPTKYRARK